MALADKDYLDTRDIDERIEALLDSERDEDEEQELTTLTDFRDDNVGDLYEWDSGVTLIADSKWEEYAEELAYDFGMVEHDSAIASYVDWERWARDVAVDYITVTLDGREFYARP